MSGNGGSIIRSIATREERALSVFASREGEIYGDDGGEGPVKIWKLTSNASVMVLDVNMSCAGLFLDLNEAIYCSPFGLHEVKRTPKGKPKGSVRIAGTGSPGSASNQFNSAVGIFVDRQFTLFVADCYNDRIQRFFPSQLNSGGMTVAGMKSDKPFALSCPTGLIVDGKGNLFIVDSDKHRIVASDINGFRCLGGCSGSNGQASHQLNQPRRLAFDSFGNLFVTDRDNYRVQKFWLKRNSCGKKFASDLEEIRRLSLSLSRRLILLFADLY